MALSKQEKIVAVKASENIEVGSYAEYGQIYMYLFQLNPPPPPAH